MPGAFASIPGFPPGHSAQSPHIIRPKMYSAITTESITAGIPGLIWSSGTQAYNVRCNYFNVDYFWIYP